MGYNTKATATSLEGATRSAAQGDDSGAIVILLASIAASAAAIADALEAAPMMYPAEVPF